MKILFTGGGSGGHVFPVLAVAREIRNSYKKEEKLEFYYLGPKDDFGVALFSKEGIVVKRILAGKIRRYINPLSILQNIFDVLFKFPISLVQSFIYIFFLTPDLIFSKGGYGSVPVVLCGWLMQVPIFLHESDIFPGLANRILSKFALEIFVSFPAEKTEYLPKRKMMTVGNPIRPGLLSGSAERGRELFKLTGEKPVVLILGGSQGAQRINDILLQVLAETLIDFELIHQTGTKNFKQVEAEARVMITQDLKKYYHPYPFLNEEEISHAYQAAELVVSRAGSATIFEIATNGKPSILIPLPEAAQNHQTKNAYAYAEAGAALVIEEPNLTPHFFLEKLKFLFSNPGQLKEMGERARKFSRPQAARIIAEYIVAYLG